VMGALILGNTNTRIMEIQAHSHMFAVVSAITCVVLVLATTGSLLDMVGRLGINELHDISSNNSRRNFIRGDTLQQSLQ